MKPRVAGGECGMKIKPTAFAFDTPDEIDPEDAFSWVETLIHKTPLYTQAQMLEVIEQCAKVSGDTVTAMCGLPDVERLIALGDDIAENIIRLKETLI